VLSFVNTRATAIAEEQWIGPTEFAGWLSEHVGTPADLAVTAADLAAAKELRDALVTIMLDHAGHGVSADELAEAENRVAKIGAAHPLTTSPTVHGVKLVPLQSGVAGVLGGVLAAATTVILEGHWDRMRACGNPQCRTAFYDRTRNSSGAYWPSNTCGSKMAMRSYRKRKASAAATTVAASNGD
jgi:predicted RNA-binding Zn ribbon-like protein